MSETKPKYQDKEWLRKQYEDKNLTTKEIAQKCDTKEGTIAYWKGKINEIKNKNGDKKKICPVCGKEFTAQNNQKTCSKDCGIIYSRNITNYDSPIHSKNSKKQYEQECAYCGKVYTGTHNSKYCSDKCSKLAQSNPDYYAVFYRDHFRCRYCGKTPADNIRLTIDHVYPKSKGGKEHKFNLVTACRGCNSHKGATKWSDERIKEIWWQNKQLAQDTSEKGYEEVVEEFKEEYPDITMPDLRGGH